MPTTTNFGWTTPADTDLVKDGAAAIRTALGGVDTSFVDLKGGTTGQVLSKTSNTDLDFTWVAQDDSNAIQNAIVDAKGDLISATAADTPARLASSGVNGEVLTIDTSTSTGLKWATPSGGLTWTSRFVDTLSDIFCGEWNGSLYVLAGVSGILFTSTDGKTWTSRTSGFGAQNINRVIYANSLWVAVGANGLISTSTDGTTWTARTANMSTNAMNDVAWNGTYFVAVGQGGGATNTGGITYSTDGITWTRKNQTPTIGTTYHCICWNGTNFIVGATLSTNNYLYASDPSATWTAAVTTSTATIVFLRHLSGQTYRQHDSGTVIIRNTGTTLASGDDLDIASNFLTTASGSSTAGRSNNDKYIYDGKLFFADGNYYQFITLTFGATTGQPTGSGSLSILPTVVGNSTLSNSRSAIIANSLGTLIAAQDGRIFTSF